MKNRDLLVFQTDLNRHSRKKSNRLRWFSLLKYDTLLEQNSYVQHLKQKYKTTSDLKPNLISRTSKCIYVSFQISKFPVDCDAMIHDLKYFFSKKNRCHVISKIIRLLTSSDNIISILLTLVITSFISNLNTATLA